MKKIYIMWVAFAYILAGCSGHSTAHSEHDHEHEHATHEHDHEHEAHDHDHEAHDHDHEEHDHDHEGHDHEHEHEHESHEHAGEISFKKAQAENSEVHLSLQTSIGEEERPSRFIFHSDALKIS